MRQLQEGLPVDGLAVHRRPVQIGLTPMSTDTPPAKSGLNVTAIIIAAMVCLTAIVLAFLFMEPAGRTESSVKGAKLDARPPLPFFVVFKETGVWRGHWKVANIWAKPEATLPIKLEVEVESSVDGATKTWIFYFDQHTVDKPVEFGFSFFGASHQFVVGDKLTLRHRDFAPTTVICK